MPADIPASHQDLLEAQFAVLATLSPAGRVQQSIVWFLAEDGNIAISLSSDRRKTTNLQQNPTCSLLIPDPSSGYRYLEVRGEVEIVPDSDYEFAQKVGTKYGGADLRQYDGPDDRRFKVTVVPDRVRAVDLRG